MGAWLATRKTEDFLGNLVFVNIFVYDAFCMKSPEFQRWLARQGVTFGTRTGSHLKLYYRGRQSVLPMHSKDLGKGLVEAIKKPLGLPGKES